MFPQTYIPSQSLTWNLKMIVSNRNISEIPGANFQVNHVKFQGGYNLLINGIYGGYNPLILTFLSVTIIFFRWVGSTTNQIITWCFCFFFFLGGGGGKGVIFFKIIPCTLTDLTPRSLFGRCGAT